MSQVTQIISGGGGGGGITTINGDVGSVTGSTITLTGGTSGSVFTGSGTTMTESFNFLSLPTTSSTNGQILINSVPSLHFFGSDNVFLGQSSGNFTFSSSGFLACNTNTAVGFETLHSISSSVQNSVAIGSISLLSLTTGKFNTCVGGGSASNLVSGARNCAIGGSAGSAWTASESDNISIGFSSSIAGTNNQLNIGVATGTGQGDLNASFICGIQTIVVSGTPVLVSATDQLGVAASSAQFKSDIQDMASDSSSVLTLRPVTFTWNKESTPGLKNATDARQDGLIAEEVHEVMPALVNYDKKGKPFSVNYHDLPIMLLNELQKALKRIDALEAQIGAK